MVTTSFLNSSTHAVPHNYIHSPLSVHSAAAIVVKLHSEYRVIPDLLAHGRSQGGSDPPGNRRRSAHTVDCGSFGTCACVNAREYTKRANFG